MSALSSIAALPMVVTAAPSIAEEAEPVFESDREILRIAAEIFELRPDLKAAEDAADVACDEQMRRRPPFPEGPHADPREPSIARGRKPRSSA